MPLTPSSKLKVKGYEARRDLRKDSSRKSPAMAAYENLLNEKMEDMIPAAFYRTKSLRETARVFNISPSTLRVWFRQLGFYHCVKCSRRTGKLFTHATLCDGCDRWFCDGCLEDDQKAHTLDLVTKRVGDRSLAKAILGW